MHRDFALALPIIAFVVFAISLQMEGASPPPVGSPRILTPEENIAEAESAYCRDAPVSGAPWLEARRYLAEYHPSSLDCGSRIGGN